MPHQTSHQTSHTNIYARSICYARGAYHGRTSDDRTREELGTLPIPWAMVGDVGDFQHFSSVVND